MYPPDTDVRALTKQLASEGVNLLNFWRLAPTESEHVQALVDLLDLPDGAWVCDLGSGTGALAGYLAALRPDIMVISVNDDQWQLSKTTAGLRSLSDLADTGLPGGYDAVILAYALGHSPVAKTLREAKRLLREGGKLAVHDFYAPTLDDQAQVHAYLNYHSHNLHQLRYWAHLVGFDAVSFTADPYPAPGPTVAEAVRALGDLPHGVQVFTRTERPDRFTDRTVALEFSGGKDSLACLMLLEPFLGDLTVYWLNTGDGCPETAAVTAWARARVPHFKEVRSDVKAWRAEHGMPSDLVPANNHAIGLMYGMASVKISNRFDCCSANIMLPLHAAVMADGCDLLIRGTKEADTGTVPFEGHHDGFEVWLPLRDWSHADVFEFLRDTGAPQNPIYDHFTALSAPECLGCTAWWGDGKAAYLKSLHPDHLATYRWNLRVISTALIGHMSELDAELEG